MQSKTDATSYQHYNSALDKIKAVLRWTEKDHLEEIDEHIAVITHPAIKYQTPYDLYLQPILNAIAKGLVIDIKYGALESDEITQRKVEPVGIYNLGSHWYLIAFCRLRNDYRNFRTDRIEKLICTDEIIAKIHPPLQSFINQTSANREVIKVIIDVEYDVIKYFGDQKYYNGFVKEETIDDYVRMTFLTGSLQGFARWFMLFGDHAKIIEPVELNDLVISIAENILKKVEETQMLLT
jgi:predicted DNA-binding transcriptional regulator YafY